MCLWVHPDRGGCRVQRSGVTQHSRATCPLTCVCVDVNECEEGEREEEGEGEGEPICEEGKYCFNTQGSYRCNGESILLLPRDIPRLSL